MLISDDALASSDMNNQQKGEEQGALSVTQFLPNMIADPRSPSSMPPDFGAQRQHVRVRLSGRGAYACSVNHTWLK
jgi:hypothetical protein